MNFVLDASVALLWLVPGTNPAGVDYAGMTLKALKESQAIVPSLLALEIANVVVKVETRGIVTAAEAQRFIALLERLSIVTDQATAAHALPRPIVEVSQRGWCPRSRRYFRRRIRRRTSARLAHFPPESSG